MRIPRLLSCLFRLSVRAVRNRRYLPLLGLLPALILPVLAPRQVAAEPNSSTPRVLRAGFLQRVFYETDLREHEQLKTITAKRK